MNEEEGRAAVIAEVKKWVGTPFRDQADKIGVGVDCAMLAIRCFVDTGILPAFDPRPYEPKWFLHQDKELFLGWIEKCGEETGKVLPGNVVVYREGRCFSHCGIITDQTTIIHAWWPIHQVQATPLFDIRLTHLRNGKERPRKIFDIWAKRK